MILTSMLGYTSNAWVLINSIAIPSKYNIGVTVTEKIYLSDLFSKFDYNEKFTYKYILVYVFLLDIDPLD